MRNLVTHTSPTKEAEVWFDSEWDEYVVKFFTITVMTRNHLRKADYHTDNKQDAFDTAQHFIKGN